MEKKTYKYPLYPTLNQYLYAMLGSVQLVDKWYESPNRAFDLKCPIDLLRGENIDRARVYKYVLAAISR